MFLAATNKVKQLLYLGYCGHVTAAELKKEYAALSGLLADLPSGFRVLADLSRLDTMDPACAAEIGKIMDLCDAKGVEAVVRVIPDPKKDIGLNILSLFHYRKPRRVTTCKTMQEAAGQLSL